MISRTIYSPTIFSAFHGRDFFRGLFLDDYCRVFSVPVLSFVSPVLVTFIFTPYSFWFFEVFQRLRFHYQSRTQMTKNRTTAVTYCLLLPIDICTRSRSLLRVNTHQNGTVFISKIQDCLKISIMVIIHKYNVRS